MTSHKILIVDDEGPVVRAVKRELADLAAELKCELKSFVNPREALNFINGHSDNVAVLISDQKMPEMKGCELIERTKKINNRITTILLTAYTDMEDIIKTIRSGLTSFIMKPWKEDDLLGEVRNAYETYRDSSKTDKLSSRLNEDLRQSGSLQRKMMKPDLPEDPRIAFSVQYNPYLSCGGDFYDVISVTDDSYLIIIGDVAGHGVKPACITFTLKAILNESAFRNQLFDGAPPATLLKWINVRIFRELKNVQPLLLTLSLCLLDLKKETMSLSNGGHVHPLILRNRDIIEAKVQGTALGYRTDLDFAEQTFELCRKDKIILYTDGLTEIKGGKERLFEIIKFYRYNRYFSSVIMDEINKALPEIKQKDDMTLINIEINE